jgi:hypothetical protein
MDFNVHKHQCHRHGPLAICWALLLSIPFYYLWNHLAPIYAPGLPELYKHLPFWDTVGLCALAAIVRAVALP